MDLSMGCSGAAGGGVVPLLRLKTDGLSLWEYCTVPRERPLASGVVFCPLSHENPTGVLQCWEHI